MKKMIPSEGGARSRERGGILMVATLVIVVMLVMAIPFLFKLSAGYRSTERGYQALAAFNLAEEGVDRALWEINLPWVVPNGLVSLDANGNGSLLLTNEAVGEQMGTIRGTVTTDIGVTPNTRTVLSIGAMPTTGGNTVQRTVAVVLEKYFKSIWDFAFFGDIGIYGRNNWKPINSFDPNRPGYVGNQAHMGTNATGDNSIDIGWPAEIYGKLCAGVGSNPVNINTVINVDDRAIKDGDKMILSATFEMPPVDVYNMAPESKFRTPYNDYKTWFTTPPSVEGPLLSSQVNPAYLKGALTDTNLTPDDSGVYTNCSFKNKTITVTGNVAIYLTGLNGAAASFSGKNTNFNISPNSSLTLILGKTNWDVDNNFDFNNNTQRAENLLILGTPQFTGAFDFRNNDTIYAAIYMPSGSFINRDNISLYGACICHYIEVRNNIDFHYDESLGDLTAIKGGIPFWRLKNWQEVIGN